MNAGTSWKYDGKVGREGGKSEIQQEDLRVCGKVKTCSQARM